MIIIGLFANQSRIIHGVGRCFGADPLFFAFHGGKIDRTTGWRFLYEDYISETSSGGFAFPGLSTGEALATSRKPLVGASPGLVMLAAELTAVRAPVESRATIVTITCTLAIWHSYLLYKADRMSPICEAERGKLQHFESQRAQNVSCCDSFCLQTKHCKHRMVIFYYYDKTIGNAVRSTTQRDTHSHSSSIG